MSDYQLQPEEVRLEIDKELESHAKLKSDRANFETNWDETLQYVVPRKEGVTSERPAGDKRGADLFDTTAIMANQLLAGALHGMLTNPATRFFDLSMGDPELDDDEEVHAWLEDSADKMYSTMNGSNFQTEIHEIYLDECSIGTACLFMGEHKEQVVHFNARPMREIFVEEDNLGRIDKVNREFKWKPRQIVQEFGEDKVPNYVRENYKKGCNDDWEILHVVAPNEAGGYFKYKSLYILKDQKLMLSKGGFPEMPYAVPRWTKTSGEKYGRGPGMEMLPDIKMVNKMMETTLQGAQLTVRPPYTATDDGVIGKVRLTPAGVTILRPGAELKQLVTDARIDFGYQAVDDVRKRIKAGFYGDLFQLRDGPQMTATEVNTISEQQMRLMGPVLGRQHFELLKVVIDRVFPIMDRRKMFKPKPDKIKGKMLTVRYSSLIARAQRMSEGQNFARAMSVATPLINMKPEVMDIVNADKSFRNILNIYGVSAKTLASTRDIKQTRDARSEANKQMAQQKVEQHQADIASKVGPAVAQVQTSQKGLSQ